MDILVINLMRLGDLIQSTPVLRRLRAEYPGSRVSLVVMDLFEDTARLLPGVDRLLAFPSSRLAAMLDQNPGWPEAVSYLDRWLTQHFPQKPDLIINLTPTRLGGTLAFALGAPEIRGMALNQNRDLVTRPAWASYSLIISRARMSNPFNLVDLFLREAGLTPDGAGLEVTVNPETAQEAEEALAALNLAADTAMVGLMPGASRPERCWPPESFAQAALQLLRRRPCHFFIFGSAQEAPLGRVVAQGLPEGTVTELPGKTPPGLLAAYLARLHLLITNDTGPMHLAAAVGTPTLAVFLASARVQDTGPVGRGHVILEPRLSCHPCVNPCPRPLCQQAISPDLVASLALNLLEGGYPCPPGEPAGEDSPRIYLGASDPWGYQAFLPLLRQPLTRRDFFIWLHRWVWGEFLDGEKPGGANLGDWVIRVLEEYYLPPEENPVPSETEEALVKLIQIAGRAEALAGEIASLAAGAREFPVRLWIKNESLKRMEQSLRQLAVAVPELAAHLGFFFQEQWGTSEVEIVPLAVELNQAYARLRQLAELTLKRLSQLRDHLFHFGRWQWSDNLAQSLQENGFKQGLREPESEGMTCR